MALGLQIRAGIAAVALGACLLASTLPVEAFFWSLFRGPAYRGPAYVEAPPEIDYEDVIVVPKRERTRPRPFTRLRGREHARQTEDAEPPRRVSRGGRADQPAAPGRA